MYEQQNTGLHVSCGEIPVLLVTASTASGRDDWRVVDDWLGPDTPDMTPSDHRIRPSDGRDLDTSWWGWGPLQHSCVRRRRRIASRRRKLTARRRLSSVYLCRHGSLTSWHTTSINTPLTARQTGPWPPTLTRQSVTDVIITRWAGLGLSGDSNLRFHYRFTAGNITSYTATALSSTQLTPTVSAGVHCAIHHACVHDTRSAANV